MTSQTEPVVIDVVTEPALNLGALTPQPLQYPPAVRTPADAVRTAAWAAEQAAEVNAPKRCLCGKNPHNPDAHGGMTCIEVLDIEARVKFSGLTRRQQLRARLRDEEPSGWRLPLGELYAAQRAMQAAMRRKAAEQHTAQANARLRQQKEAEVNA